MITYSNNYYSIDTGIHDNVCRSTGVHLVTYSRFDQIKLYKYLVYDKDDT